MRSPPLLATTTGTDWSSGTVGTLTLLDSSSVNITLTNIESHSTPNSDLSDTTKFCPPLASSQESIDYSLTTASNWTAAFNSSVSNLLMYTIFFRGTLSGSANPTTYTFTSGGSPISPTLLSGVNGSVSGNILSVPMPGYFSGVLQFSGPLSSLTVTSNTATASGSGNSQAFTFAVSDQIGSCLTPAAPTDAPPTATHLQFTQSSTLTPTWTLGETLQILYTYNDPNGDPENGTTFQWYQANDANCTLNKTPIPNATALTYTATDQTIDQYLCVGVTPKNNLATGVETLITTPQAITAPTHTPIPPSYLPDQLSLSIQLRGTGTGTIHTDTGLNCHTNNCLRNPDHTVTCDSQACSQIINTASTVTLIPKADPGSHFVGWGGHTDCLRENLLMNGNKLCIAYFRLYEYPLTLTLQGQGTVTAPNLNCPDTCFANYPYNTSVILQPQPAKGWQLETFIGDCDPTGQVLITDSKQCTAIFVPDPITYDQDFDQIPSSQEDASPNHGDGNNDGILDSQQNNVSSFLDLYGTYLTLQVQDHCPITNVYSELPDQYPKPRHPPKFPQGLLYFELSCPQTQITIYYHGVGKLLKNMKFYKFGPKIPGNLDTLNWYEYPVTLTTQTIDQRSVVTANYFLKDGELGDSTLLDGKIIDPGNLGLSQSTESISELSSLSILH